MENGTLQIHQERWQRTPGRNMAAPGIPNGGIVIGATYLSLLGMKISQKKKPDIY